MATMGHFGSLDHLTALIVNQCQSRDAAAWIDLVAQRLHLWLLYPRFESDRKRVALVYRSFPGREQDTRIAWMNRVECLFVGVYYKDFAH